jgi:hypothetical protein
MIDKVDSFIEIIKKPFYMFLIVLVHVLYITAYIGILKYNVKYIDYLIRSWAREMTGDGMMKVGQAKELQRINTEYWNNKTDDSTQSFQMGGNVLDLIDETPSLRSIMRANGSLAQVTSKSMAIGLKGGRFQLRR